MKQKCAKPIFTMLFCKINYPFKSKLLMIFDQFINKYFKAT